MFIYYFGAKITELNIEGIKSEDFCFGLIFLDKGLVIDGQTFLIFHLFFNFHFIYSYKTFYYQIR